jgi:hypothetical protein
MDRFVHHANLRLLREALARTNSEAESQRIVKMIEAEEVKQRESKQTRSEIEENSCPIL